MRKGECYGGLYRVIRFLGRGGQGSVSLVVHERSLRLMALKEIPLNGREWNSFEKSHFCHLSHKGIPKIYDLFLENGKGYLVMEYIPGWNLGEYQERKGRFSRAQLTELSVKLADILCYLHSRTPPLIHGDIKPGNLILKENGELVLVDFGAALKKEEKIKNVYVTRGFSAPEQFLKDGKVDVYSDIYSFGRTFQVLSKGQRGNRGIRRIFRKCTAPNPKRRYRSAEKLRRALRFYQKKMYFYSLFLSIGSCVFLGMGTLYQKAAEIKQKERTYQEALLSNHISSIKSAIHSDPGREEGYLKLLEKYISDGSFSGKEAMEMEKEMSQGELHFTAGEQNYLELCYNLGLAYWYYYEGEEGRRYSTVWFQKIISEETDFPQKERAKQYYNLGKCYEQKEKKERTGEGEFSYQEFFLALEAMTETAGENENLKERWSEELIGKLYESGEEFAAAGIERSRMFGLLNRGKEGWKEFDQSTWEVITEWLEGVYERREES